MLLHQNVNRRRLCKKKAQQDLADAHCVTTAWKMQSNFSSNADSPTKCGMLWGASTMTNLVQKNFYNLRVDQRNIHTITKLQKVSDIITATTWWIPWKECNNRIFHSETRSSQEIVRIILLLAVDWTKNSDKTQLTKELSSYLTNSNIARVRMKEPNSMQFRTHKTLDGMPRRTGFTVFGWPYENISSYSCQKINHQLLRGTGTANNLSRTNMKHPGTQSGRRQLESGSPGTRSFAQRHSDRQARMPRQRMTYCITSDASRWHGSSGVFKDPKGYARSSDLDRTSVCSKAGRQQPPPITS